MRMGELAQNQNQLSDEQRHLDGLINMKAGSNAMLSEIHVNLEDAGNNGTLSLAEDALSATSKSLRILLHVGQHPIKTWNAIEPQLRHVHNALTQQFLSENDTSVDFSVLKASDLICDTRPGDKSRTWAIS